MDCNILFFLRNLSMALFAGWVINSATAFCQQGSDELLRATIAHRNEIERARLAGEVVSSVNGTERSRMKLWVWSDYANDRHRLDREYSTTEGVEIPRRVDCWQCVHEGYFLQYKESIDPRQAQHTVSFFGSRPDDFVTYHTKNLGCSPMGLDSLEDAELEWLSRRLGSVTVNPSEANLPQKVEEEIAGRQTTCYMSTNDGESGKRIVTHCVVDRGRGPSVVFCSFRLTAGDRTLLYSDSFSRLKNWDGRWFPETVEFTRQVGEGDIEEKVLAVDMLSFDEFPRFDRLADLNIQEGALVIGEPNTPSGIRQWREGVARKADVVAVTNNRPLRYGRPTHILTLLVFVFAFALLGRWLVKRRG